MRRQRPSYPLGYKSNSMCRITPVRMGAFSSLEFAAKFKDTNYVWFLAKMLDYEKSTPMEYQEASEQKCPAIDGLEWLNEAGKNVVSLSHKRNQAE
jgi:hypothetical protein